MSPTPQRIAVIGSALTGGAAQVIDALVKTPAAAVAVFDRDPNARQVLGVPVRGSSDVKTICAHFERGEFDAAVIAIGGNLRVREQLFVELREEGIPFTNVVDPTAQLRTGVRLGTGNVLLGNVYLGPNVILGDNCYVIDNTTIQHDTVVGSHVFCSTHVAIAGNLTIGDRVRFSTRSGANAKLAVGDDAEIGAGVVLIEDLPAGHCAQSAAVEVVENVG